jgi:hypothetical protein
VEVGTTVAPAVQVHPADVAERQDRALDPGRQRSERGGCVRRQVAERVDMLAARQPDSSRETALDWRMQTEVLVLPDGLRRLAAAEAAGLAAGLAAAWRLGDDALVRLADGQRLGVGSCMVRLLSIAGEESRRPRRSAARALQRREGIPLHVVRSR